MVLNILLITNALFGEIRPLKSKSGAGDGAGRKSEKRRGQLGGPREEGKGHPSK